MVTPSQMKVVLEILQLLPIDAFFCTSTNAPIFTSSPTVQPYMLMNLDNLTLRPSLTSGAIQTCSLRTLVLIERLFCLSPGGTCRPLRACEQRAGRRDRR